MSVFDTRKNYTIGTVKPIKQTTTGTPELQSWTFRFEALPKTLEELQALNICDLSQPQNTAALTLLALCVFHENQQECFRMLDFLNGPMPFSATEKQFLRERFMEGGDYIPFSYFSGATPENDYKPDKPYTLVISEQANSRADLSIGYLTLYFKSGGADTARHIKLRQKDSNRNWYFYEQFLMVGIRRPASKDPWA